MFLAISPVSLRGSCFREIEQKDSGQDKGKCSGSLLRSRAVRPAAVLKWRVIALMKLSATYVCFRLHCHHLDSQRGLVSESLSLSLCCPPTVPSFTWLTNHLLQTFSLKTSYFAELCYLYPQTPPATQRPDNNAEHLFSVEMWIDGISLKKRLLTVIYKVS